MTRKINQFYWQLAFWITKMPLKSMLLKKNVNF